MINAFSRRPSVRDLWLVQPRIAASLRPTDTQGNAGSRGQSPAPPREGLLVNLTETPSTIHDADHHDYLSAKGGRQASKDVIYSSPKPRLVDIEESPSPPSEEPTGEQSKSPGHQVDVAIIGHSPHTDGEAIISAPAGHTKEDGSVAKAAEEAVKELNGEGKLIDITVTETEEPEDEVEGSTDADASDSTTKAPTPTTSALTAASTSTSASTSTGGKKRKNKKKKKGGQ